MGEIKAYLWVIAAALDLKGHRLLQQGYQAVGRHRRGMRERPGLRLHHSEAFRCEGEPHCREEGTGRGGRGEGETFKVLDI